MAHSETLHQSVPRAGIEIRNSLILWCSFWGTTLKQKQPLVCCDTKRDRLHNDIMHNTTLLQEKTLYICSVAHSGSTIIELLLGGHPDIASLGEVSSLAHDILLNQPCTCGKPLTHCSEWKPIFSSIKEKSGIDFKKNPYRFRLGATLKSVQRDSFQKNPWNNIVNHYYRGLEYLYFKFFFSKILPLPSHCNTEVENTLTVYDLARIHRGKRVIVDSSKRYLKALELYKKAPDMIRILFLVRDGRSVFASHLKRKWPRHIAYLAWKNFYSRALPLMQHYIDPKHWHIMQFENFLQQPNYHLERICKLVDIDISHLDKLLAFDRRNLHSAGGNLARFEKKLELRQDEGWRPHLSKEEIHYFNKKSGNLNKVLGYE